MAPAGTSVDDIAAWVPVRHAFQLTLSATGLSSGPPWMLRRDDVLVWDPAVPVTRVERSGSHLVIWDESRLPESPALVSAVPSVDLATVRTPWKTVIAQLRHDLEDR